MAYHKVTYLPRPSTRGLLVSKVAKAEQGRRKHTDFTLEHKCAPGFWCGPLLFFFAMPRLRWAPTSEVTLGASRRRLAYIVPVALQMLRMASNVSGHQCTAQVGMCLNSVGMHDVCVFFLHLG